MRVFLLSFLILLNSCGKVDHKASGKVQVDVSGSVLVRHEFSLNELKTYFREVCIDELPSDATNQEINACVNDKISDFLEVLGA